MHTRTVAQPSLTTAEQELELSGAPLKPPRDDSALRALSSLRGLRGAPEVPPLCRETSVSRTANVGSVGMNGLRISIVKQEINFCNFKLRDVVGYLLSSFQRGQICEMFTVFSRDVNFKTFLDSQRMIQFLIFTLFLNHN